MTSNQSAYRLTPVALTAILLAALPALATAAQRVDTYLVDDGKHPTAHQDAFVIQQDSDGDVNLCFGYANDFAKANTGSFRGKGSLTRIDPETDLQTVEKFGKRGNLRGNKWVRCVITGPVRQGDMVVFDYEFIGLPRPRGRSIHIRSSVGEGRLLISELRGPEAQTSGEAPELHRRHRSIVTENGKHPKAAQQAYVVARDSLGQVQFCFGYGNNFSKDQGRVIGKATITRRDPETEEISVEEFSKKGAIRKNQFLKCAEIEPLRLGDTAVVDYEFDGLPRLRGNARVAAAAATGGDAFEIVTGTGVTQLSKGEFLGRAPSGGGEGGGDGGDTGDDGGGDGGGTGPPTDTGVVSAADQLAISAMSKMTAISVGNRVRGARTFLIGHRYDCTNLMEAPTIAAVYDRFVKACGRRATGGALTRSEIDAIAKLVRMKHTSALRWESGGRVIGEYWSAATGTRKFTAKTIEAAVAWLVSEGRLP